MVFFEEEMGESSWTFTNWRGEDRADLMLGGEFCSERLSERKRCSQGDVKLVLNRSVQVIAEREYGDSCCCDLFWYRRFSDSISTKR